MKTRQQQKMWNKGGLFLKEKWTWFIFLRALLCQWRAQKETMPYNLIRPKLKKKQTNIGDRTHRRRQHEM